jgi:hypothetical protein
MRLAKIGQIVVSFMKIPRHNKKLQKNRFWSRFSIANFHLLAYTTCLEAVRSKEHRLSTGSLGRGAWGGKAPWPGAEREAKPQWLRGRRRG